eukprot:11863007-Ditylum_brightwellii.AAC.1
MGFLNKCIASKAIPQPQLLVKDHKEGDENSDFPTILVILATNVTAIFSKMSYMMIQKVLDDTGVIYNKHTIIQSSDLKKKLEDLQLTKSETMLMSLDIESMYLSVWVKLIKKTLEYYSRGLSAEEKGKIVLGMCMVQFSMKSTL